ncbi:MAG TPA: DinB family protein [Pyrinomonadaceae bacterium]|jgi:uncharacterized damage-inducible protein DinB|nr:DinB family protein [Pyrinomonadaceae bacterium]
MENSSPDVARAFIDRASAFLSTEYLPKIERCLEQLTDAQIWFRPNEASNSIGNLVLHLCGNARQWIVSGVGDSPDRRDRDSEFRQRKIIPKVELLELLRTTINEVEQVLADLDSNVILERRTIQGKDVELLEAIFHVTEHFSMHTGQIILLTKMLAQTDMKFYDFSSGAPVNRWNT